MGRKKSLKDHFVASISLGIRPLAISFSFYCVPAQVLVVVFRSKMIVIKGFGLDALRKTSIYLSC